MRSFKVQAQLAEYTVKIRKTKCKEFDPKKDDGKCDFNTKTIWISGNLSPDSMFVTFWHEYVHAITSEMDRDELTYNEPFVETISQNIAKAARALPEDLK